MLWRDKVLAEESVTHHTDAEKGDAGRGGEGKVELKAAKPLNNC